MDKQGAFNDKMITMTYRGVIIGAGVCSAEDGSRIPTVAVKYGEDKEVIPDNGDDVVAWFTDRGVSSAVAVDIVRAARTAARGEILDERCTRLMLIEKLNDMREDMRRLISNGNALSALFEEMCQAAGFSEADRLRAELARRDLVVVNRKWGLDKRKEVHE